MENGDDLPCNDVGELMPLDVLEVDECVELCARQMVSAKRQIWIGIRIVNRANRHRSDCR